MTGGSTSRKLSDMSGIGVLVVEGWFGVNVAGEQHEQSDKQTVAQHAPLHVFIAWSRYRIPDGFSDEVGKRATE